MRPAGCGGENNAGGRRPLFSSAGHRRIAGVSSRISSPRLALPLHSFCFPLSRLVEKLKDAELAMAAAEAEEAAERASELEVR